MDCIKRGVKREKTNEYIIKLSERLKENLPSISEGHNSDTMEFYEAIKKYPNGLCDDSVQTYQDLTKKIDWVLNELDNISELPEQRFNDLQSFCISLSRTFQNRYFSGIRRLTG